MKRNVLILAVFAMLCLFHLPEAISQAVNLSKKVTLDTRGKSYKVVFEALEKQCGCFFAYNPSFFHQEQPTGRFEKRPLSEVLDRLLLPLSLDYKTEGQNILIFRKTNDKGAYQQKKGILNGYVRDAETGEELIGAAVLVKGTTTGSTTNPYGFYALTLPEGTYTLPFTYQNMTPTDPIQPVQYKYIQDFMFSDADFTIVGVEEHEVMKKDFAVISQNMPNPASDFTRFTIALENSASVAVNVTNLMGQNVISLPAQQLGQGTHNINLDVSDLVSGVYFYTVEAGNQSITKKMIVE